MELWIPQVLAKKNRIILNCNPLCVIHNIVLLFQWPWTLKKFCWQTNPFWLRSFVCVRLEWLWLWNINFGSTKLGRFLPKSDQIEGKSALEQFILSFLKQWKKDNWKELCNFFFKVPYAGHYNPQFAYFLPTFWSPKTFFQGAFLLKFKPDVWLVFKSSF